MFKTTYNKDKVIRVFVVTGGPPIRSLMTVKIIESDNTGSGGRRWRVAILWRFFRKGWRGAFLKTRGRAGLISPVVTSCRMPGEAQRGRSDTLKGAATLCSISGQRAKGKVMHVPSPRAMHEGD